MNINDVAIEDLWKTATELYHTTNPLQIIFNRQRELMEKYLVLEAEILCESQVGVPVDIHSARGQRILKERAWWFTEELVEAMDALKESNDTKFLEEISDSIHFLTELWILAGLPLMVIECWDDMLPSYNCYACPEVGSERKKSPLSPAQTRHAITNIIIYLGRAMWQLRNKPWKKTQVLTDIPRFADHLKNAYDQLIRLLYHGYGLSLQEIALLYLRKSEVNKFRQRSNY